MRYTQFLKVVFFADPQFLLFCDLSGKNFTVIHNFLQFPRKRYVYCKVGKRGFQKQKTERKVGQSKKAVLLFMNERPQRTICDPNSSAVMIRYRELATTIAFSISLDYVKGIRNRLGKKKGIIQNSCDAERAINTGEWFFKEKLWLYLNDPTIDPKEYKKRLIEVAKDDEKYKNFSRFNAKTN